MAYPEPFRNATEADSAVRRDALGDDAANIRKERVPKVGPLMFLPFLALFVAGLWLLGYGFERASGPLFVAGILAAGVAFLIPVGRPRD